MRFHSQNMLIRPARIDDANRIREIFTPYIENTVFNLEETVRSIEYYEQLILDSFEHLPFLVAEYNERVIGFVYVSELSYMLNLSNTCSLSIYVADDSPVKGVGSQLLQTLEDELSLIGIQQIIANIVASNIKSIQFHERNGFQLLSTFPQAGYKFGQWHDVKWFGKKIEASNNAVSSTTQENILLTAINQ